MLYCCCGCCCCFAAVIRHLKRRATNHIVSIAYCDDIWHMMDGMGWLIVARCCCHWVCFVVSERWMIQISNFQIQMYYHTMQLSLTGQISTAGRHIKIVCILRELLKAYLHLMHPPLPVYLLEKDVHGASRNKKGVHCPDLAFLHVDISTKYKSSLWSVQPALVVSS